MINTLKSIAFQIRVKIGYSAAFILLLVSYVLTLYGNNQLMKQTESLIHTNKVINNMEMLVSGVKDAETGLRGYINTKDTVFLQPYKNSYEVVNTNYTALKEDTKNDITQQSSLKSLNSFIEQRYDKLRFAIEYYPGNNYIITDTLLHSFYSGKVIMDSIRAIINNMQIHEQDLSALRKKELDAKYRALNVIIITSFILALIFAIFGFYTYMREYKARLISDKKVSDYQNELQHRIEELDKANKELIVMKRNEKFASTGRIARTIAHEVRNPLTNIDLAVAQIKSDMPVVDESNALLFDMVRRNCQRINQLISELLNATRFTELSYSLVSINTLLDEALDMAKDRIELNHIRIERDYNTSLDKISVDKDKVKLALLNLVVNAIEAMEPDKGILQIKTSREEKKCVIEISDNGYGMNEEEVNKVFEPYFTTKPNGNGLGLTNTANIILNHKGDISVNSKSGEGTTFVIKFDLYDLK